VSERDGWIETLNAARHSSGRGAATRRDGGRRLAAVPGATPLSPRLLDGTYEIVREIGRGGMGIVYEGRDRRLDRQVAVKEMRRDLGLNGGERRLFLDEARLSASLHHPFIVDIYAVIEDGADIFLVFEYVSGRTLQEQLDRDGPLRPAAIVEPLRQICAALAYAHSCRVIHRDLKPSNVMTTTHGFAKIMDFGIARQIKDTAARRSVSQVDTSGTAPYMAPEQELGRSDVRSDVFALGATLYELLSGRLPFQGPNFYLQKEREMLTPLRDESPQTPACLAAAIEKCLRFDPDQRFQTIDEFAQAAGVD
jgi:serine/threonine-protein kinase